MIIVMEDLPKSIKQYTIKQLARVFLGYSRYPEISSIKIPTFAQRFKVHKHVTDALSRRIKYKFTNVPNIGNVQEMIIRCLIYGTQKKQISTSGYKNEALEKKIEMQ